MNLTPKKVGCGWVAVGFLLVCVPVSCLIGWELTLILGSIVLGILMMVAGLMYLDRRP